MAANRRTALVTGGTRGIGKAIALRLAQDGYDIAVAALSDEGTAAGNLSEIRDAVGSAGRFIYIKGNIAQAGDREYIINRTVNGLGRLDVLVNNAGVAPKERKDILETTEDGYDYVMDVNLKGTFFMTQLAAREMVKQAAAEEGREGQERLEVSKGQEGWSVILNISSVSAYAASAGRGEYCISKAGVGMVTTLFADRLAQYGIRVYEIRPGIITTDMTAGVREKYNRMIAEGLTPIKRWGYPEDVAEAAAYLCSGKLAFSTGEVINVDGGFHLRRL